MHGNGGQNPQMTAGKESMMNMRNATKGSCACAKGSCQDQMNTLRAIDFAIQETVLYLDAYPHCRQALDYYHSLVETRRELLSTYEKQCGPITMYGNESCTSWDWVNDPWPWKIEAN